MRCPNCGNDNPDDYVFCDECGARLQAMAEAQEGGSPGAAPGSDGAMASAGGEEGDGGINSWQPASGDSGGSGDAGMQAPYADSGSDTGGVAVWDSTSDADASGSGSAPWNFTGDAQSEDEAVPVTEDTVAADPDSGEGETSMPDESDSQSGGLMMPGVVPMSDMHDSGGMGSSGAGESDWKATAQRYLEEAQRALDNLRQHLDSQPSASAGAVGGGAFAQTDMSMGAPLGNSGSGMVPDMGSMEAGPSANAAGAGGYGSGLGAAESEYPSGGSGSMGGGNSSVQMDEPTMESPGTYDASEMPDMGGTGMQSSGVEPDAEAGNLGAGSGSGMGGVAGMDMGAASGSATSASTDISDSSVSQASGEEPMMARLVLIATGAEMPLPNQEEITVGREDPSSGIFPDVDLTPYGGEDGGVSRRHAKILRIGDDFFVEDLQSTNYTKLDGQRLTPSARERLEDGARLDFGRVATIFRRS